MEVKAITMDELTAPKPDKPMPKGCKRISFDEWKAEAIRLYGRDERNWRFKCPNCGHVQCGKEVRERNPSLIGTISDWITCNCEGRHTPGIGCNWTLGGLFQIHKVEVTIGQKIIRAFEFADTEPVNANQSLPVAPDQA